MADGDVIVLGSLSGRALAGLSGNEKAKIVASDMSKVELLSIANVSEALSWACTVFCFLQNWPIWLLDRCQRRSALIFVFSLFLQTYVAGDDVPENVQGIEKPVVVWLEDNTLQFGVNEE